jgi:putative tricarboxylic transport membrane protein
MEIINYLPVLLLGCSIGALVGIIPGLGPLQLLALLLIFFQGWNPLELILFYIGLITVSQYVDSIPAVYLGVPGETGAIPTAYESRFINDSQQKQMIIRFSALGRIIGCFVAVVATLFLIDSIKNVPVLFSSKTQIWLFMIALLGIAVTSRDRIWVTGFLMLSGYVLGLVGYNFYHDKEILTFGYIDLYNGLPLISILMGIYVVPSLITASKSVSVQSSSMTTSEPVSQRFVDFLPTVGRSSVLGYFLGLIPGVSYILSSNGSYSLEKWLRQKQDKYQPGDTYTCVACETGNSVGAYSTLLPLLFFGIPITVSETLIYDLMIKSGVVFNQGSFLTDNIYLITISFAICSIVALICSWPLSQLMLKFFTALNGRWLYISVTILCVLTVAVMGILQNQLEMYVIVFLLSLIPGFMLRNLDTLPLIFVFIMQNSFESTIYNLINLYQ